MNLDPQVFSKSPFHAGEQLVQERVGVFERMDKLGRKFMRPFMPDQHREFFENQPFVVVGSVDAEGWPWASILVGGDGFVSSPDPRTLKFAARAIVGDPLTEALASDAPIGLLGIEPATRRRNRVNGRVRHSDDDGFEFGVDISFGNCPQYIQTRGLTFVRDPKDVISIKNTSHFSTLDTDAQSLIERSDTFFVSSYVMAKDDPEIEGVDVSHRGGLPGFVKVEGNQLTIPDYMGNFVFNTLGNFALNPKAGLLFADFETGDLLQLTGTVELLWDQEGEVETFKGAERAWRFTLDHGRRIKSGLPFRAVFGAYSPNTLTTGNWVDAAKTARAVELKNAWRPYKIEKVVKESSVIKSFYLVPDDDEALLSFEAGQFLTVRADLDHSDAPSARTYTVSSSPDEGHYRISVKREEYGVFSRYLHDTAKAGDVIEAKAPTGGFKIDARSKRPAVLIAGGVGVTPMISMAHHVMGEELRSRTLRPLTILHAAQTTEQRAFYDEFVNLERQSNGAIRYVSFVDQPDALDVLGVDYHATGYINSDVLSEILRLDDYDFYLCGPPAFMQAIYNAVCELGVRDKRIFAEAFGPAALVRQPDLAGTAVQKVPLSEADDALVVFENSKFEQGWNKSAGTLLEFAEAHGVSPNYGCRNGVCGTCAVKLNSGKVAYRTTPSAAHGADEVLICCAVPAKGSAQISIDI